MNTRTRKFMILAAVVLTFWLCPLEQSASAQSNCKKLKANLFLTTYDPTTDTWSGPVTNAGILNGAYEEANHSCCVATPDPNVVTLLADITIITDRGQLKTTNSVITGSSIAPFAYTEFGHINPNTSTGVFAGATGMIFQTGVSVSGASGPWEVEITGEICFAL